uniref:EOG090X0BTZ n=1 Tax=Moina brachiata TaxID=675436 RepID=A0A4Y7NKT4_9CRUS|nr:EOG090X0BTZ [Moina brachiata]SVE93216.1 EOG090X0BTZ [Moina brachiata]
MSSINDDILHYQRKIEKYSTDTKVLMHCLNKLTRLPIGVQHLQATGIGRTINGMRKSEGSVGEEARALVSKWKEMVAAEDKSDSDGPAEEESHQEEVNSDQDNDKEAQNLDVKTKLKPKDSQRESKEETPSSSKSKSSSSKSKSSEKSSKSSKNSDKRKESKNKEGGSSSSSSKSRKRHHSEDDSPSHIDDDIETPTMSFEDALGSIESSSKKKKSKDKEKDKHKSDKKKSLPASSNSFPSSSSTSFLPEPSLPPPKRIEISPLDFGTSPDYKPQPRTMSYTGEAAISRHSTSEEALSVAMAQKGSRTKVFSGNRSSGLAYAPTLFDACIRVLQQNIDALEFTGGVPYELLRPVLERASARQLFELENHNPYLLEDTDELWKVLCQKKFRTAVREEMETWRDLYLRCHEELEARLKNLTNNHKQSIAKAIPVRTTKLAYVECVAKAPRGVSKSGQIKHGASAVLASMTNAKATGRPFEASMNHPSNGNSTVAEVVKMAPPSTSRSSSSSSNAPSAKKPKVAPLMQKTLKLMKNRFRR